MAQSWLAQIEIADWIEGAVFLVVIVLAALGNLTKALTRKAKQAKQEQKAKKTVQTERRQPPPRPTPAPARPVARPRPPRPVARPSPKRETRDQAAGPADPSRRFDHPDVESLPDMLREVFGQLKEASKPKTSTSTAKPAPPKPVAAPPKPPPPRPRSARRRKPAASAQTRPQTPPAPPPQKKTDLRDRHLEEFHTSFDRGLAMPETMAAAGVTPAGEPLGSIGHPTMAELRRAVVMREVLSPPVALRDPEPTWF